MLELVSDVMNSLVNRREINSYAFVGGIASMFQGGVPFITNDIDILVDGDVGKVGKFLEEMGFEKKDKYWVLDKIKVDLYQVVDELGKYTIETCEEINGFNVASSVALILYALKLGGEYEDHIEYLLKYADVDMDELINAAEQFGLMDKLDKYLEKIEIE